MNHTNILFAALFACLMIPVVGFAQDTTVTVTSTGEVGIGTTVPQELLDVAGNIAVSGTVDGVDISELKNEVGAHASSYTQFGGLNSGSSDLTATWSQTNPTSGTYSFTKQHEDSKIEVFINSRVLGGTFSGTNGITIEARVDGNQATVGNWGSVRSTNSSEIISIFAAFEGVAAGSHTVSIWAKTAPSGSSTGFIMDPGGWGGRIIVKETW